MFLNWGCQASWLECFCHGNSLVFTNLKKKWVQQLTSCLRAPSKYCNGHLLRKRWRPVLFKTPCSSVFGTKGFTSSPASLLETMMKNARATRFQSFSDLVDADSYSMELLPTQLTLASNCRSELPAKNQINTVTCGSDNSQPSPNPGRAWRPSPPPDRGLLITSRYEDHQKIDVFFSLRSDSKG